MRLFTAIELPDEVRAYLSRVQDELQKLPELSGAVSWTRPGNLHVTLKFLGEISDALVPDLIESLSRIPFEPLKLLPEGMNYFPKRGPVRVVSVGIGGDAAGLINLYDQIENACAGCGFQREGRKYTPHITLGRMRQAGLQNRAVRDMKIATPFPGPAFIAESFVLMHSQLNPTGSIYTPAARFPRP